MKKIANITALLVCMTYFPIMAFDGLTSLPSISQMHMKRGKRLDKVWVGPGFNRREGFIISQVNYDAKVTNEMVVNYLPIAFNTIGKNSSPCEMVVNVVGFSEMVNSVRPYRRDRIRIEGRIFNHRSQLVAAFQTEQTFLPDDTKFAMDDIVRSVKKDLC